MPKTNAVVETALYVKDVEQAARWYQRVFGFPVIFAQQDRFRALQVSKNKFSFYSSSAPVCSFVRTGGSIPPHDRSDPLHMAFAMEPEAEA